MSGGSGPLPAPTITFYLTRIAFGIQQKISPGLTTVKFIVAHPEGSWSFGAKVTMKRIGQILFRAESHGPAAGVRAVTPEKKEAMVFPGIELAEVADPENDAGYEDRGEWRASTFERALHEASKAGFFGDGGDEREH